MYFIETESVNCDYERWYNNKRKSRKILSFGYSR